MVAGWRACRGPMPPAHTPTWTASLSASRLTSADGSGRTSGDMQLVVRIVHHRRSPMAEDETKPDSTPQRRRRVGRYLAMFGVALATVIAALAAFLHTSYARQYVLTRVIALLQQ